MLRPERRGRAHKISAEPDVRGLLGGKQMCIDGITEIEAAMKVLIRLEVRIVVLLPALRIVVRLGEEARCAKNNGWEPLVR